MRNRLVLFDITRGLCVIWIVGIWHMNAYLNVECKFFQDGSFTKEMYSMLTNGVLATFTFISGFFMSKNLISELNDVLRFYKKRIIRFMIPLLLSSIILALGGGDFTDSYSYYLYWCFTISFASMANDIMVFLNDDILLCNHTCPDLVKIM